jgi:hypothetical protein
MDVTKLMDTLLLHGAPFVQLMALGYHELSTAELASAFPGQVLCAHAWHSRLACAGAAQNNRAIRAALVDMISRKRIDNGQCTTAFEAASGMLDHLGDSGVLRRFHEEIGEKKLSELGGVAPARMLLAMCALLLGMEESETQDGASHLTCEDRLKSCCPPKSGACSLSRSIERTGDRTVHEARLLWVVAVRIFGEPARLSIGK